MRRMTYLGVDALTIRWLETCHEVHRNAAPGTHIRAMFRREFIYANRVRQDREPIRYPDLPPEPPKPQRPQSGHPLGWPV